MQPEGQIKKIPLCRSICSEDFIHIYPYPSPFILFFYLAKTHSSLLFQLLLKLTDSVLLPP